MENIPSQAAQVLITVIPIVGITLGSVVVFFFLLWRHKQMMKMIEKGMRPERPVDLRTFSLIAGLVTSGVGLVLSVFFLVAAGTSTYSLLGGLIPLAIGLSLLAFYILTQNEPRR